MLLKESLQGRYEHSNFTPQFREKLVLFIHYFIITTTEVASYSAKQNQTKTMNTSLALVAAKALPALSGSSLTYNAEKNVYLTLGYTSAAGNTSYRAIRLSDRLAVYYHIGQGYAHTFLNGITLFAWNGQKANIIAQKFWGGCNWRCFNERSAKEESILMLKDFLKGQAKAMGSMVAESQLLDFSRSMIEATHQKCLG